MMSQSLSPVLLYGQWLLFKKLSLFLPQSSVFYNYTFTKLNSSYVLALHKITPPHLLTPCFYEKPWILLADDVFIS